MISLDGYSLTNNAATGIHRNTIEILKELDKIVEVNQIEIVLPIFSKLDLPFKNIKLTYLKGKPRTKIFRYRDKYFHDVTYKKHVKKNDYISLDMLLSFPSFGCDVIMVYDAIPNMYPNNYQDFFTKLWYKSFMKRQKKAIGKAKLILTDSNSAKGDIEKFYPNSKDKIQVVYCGWQHIEAVKEDESILNKLSLKKNEYFFTLGSRLVHKNVKWIVAAAKQNPNEIFVVTGRNTKDDDGGETLSNVIYTGYLSDEQIKALMHYCKAFIHPSMYEGFGIPPMEAMGSGARCIVSTGGSLPEVYGNSVWYINPHKYDNIDLKKIMEQKIESNDLILNKFSWAKSAQQLKEIFAQINIK